MTLRTNLRAVIVEEEGSKTQHGSDGSQNGGRNLRSEIGIVSLTNDDEPSRDELSGEALSRNTTMQRQSEPIDPVQ